MKDSQTVLLPPPGAEKTAGKGSKDHGGPKTFNFDRSYWSFSKDDPDCPYGGYLGTSSMGFDADGRFSGPGESF